MAEVRHKVFISYYHKDDEKWREKFEELFGETFINKSVKKGDINTDVSTDYIKRLIQMDYLSDSSVLVVLVGPNTWGRKHVDWEISAALMNKVGGYSGLVGILLPTHPDYKEKTYKAENIPPRLAENQKSNYAKIYDWTESISLMKDRIQDAFDARINRNDKIVNSSEQFQRNRSGE